jgi:hypothetical protein
MILAASPVTAINLQNLTHTILPRQLADGYRGDAASPAPQASAAAPSH